MAIFDLFSKRQRRLRGEIPDVYQYEDLPAPLRVQIVHILCDAYNTRVPGDANMSHYLGDFAEHLCREYGVHNLTRSGRSKKVQFLEFIETCPDVERVLDAVELSFGYMTRSFHGADQDVDELNCRFREHGVGFQLENGLIVRVDTEAIHQEAVKPVLRLLRGKPYEGAQDEFLTAHEHYRHQRYKECVNACLKAFESTMKAICDKRGWTYRKDKDTAKALTATIIREGLLPPFLESQQNAVRALLESGISTMRSKKGAHGQGARMVPTLRHEASYVLNLTATTILMLAESEESLTS